MDGAHFDSAIIHCVCVCGAINSYILGMLETSHCIDCAQFRVHKVVFEMSGCTWNLLFKCPHNTWIKFIYIFIFRDCNMQYFPCNLSNIFTAKSYCNFVAFRAIQNKLRPNRMSIFNENFVREQFIIIVNTLGGHVFDKTPKTSENAFRPLKIHLAGAS